MTVTQQQQQPWQQQQEQEQQWRHLAACVLTVLTLSCRFETLNL
jgi:hypothetical protein